MHLKSVIFILLLIVTVFLCIFLDKSRIPTYKKENSMQPPNIVVIIADDLGWNDVGYHGADEIPTPNIDALAYNGVVLDRHYVLPICTPSRTAFLTGRYPIREGMQGYPLRGAEPRGIPLNTTLLPQYLRSLGYATHLVGKWHVGYHTRNHGPTRRGFDTFLGYYSGYIQYRRHTLVETDQDGYDLHRIVGDDHKVERRYDYMTDVITEEAEKIISSHDPKRPLYLQLAHLAPHSNGMEDALEVRDWEETNATLGYIADVNRRKYASVVATLDESVGLVVRALERANMLRNSIVIFMSDNGAQTRGIMENFGSNYPLRGLKLGLYEGGVRGAACIYSPLIDTRSRISTQLFHITDWLPTLYSAAGGHPNDLKELDGIDQWSAIKSAKNDGKRELVLVNIDEKENSEAALIGRYKLVKDSSWYQKYYGDSGNDPSYPKYNARNVLESEAGSAIANVSVSVLNIDKIMKLRRELTTVCGNSKKFSNCEYQACLFDVYEDPCETTDLSLDYPEVVERLATLIDSYKSVLMRQTNSPVDPAGFPRNFNNTWMPWLPDYQSIDEAHFRQSKLRNVSLYLHFMHNYQVAER